MRPIVVAIDGPAGSGKSTTARLLAGRLGYLYLDSGAMYRAVALALLRAGHADPSEAQLGEVLDRTVIDVILDNAGNRMLLDGEDVSDEIRTPEVSSWASRFSVRPEVRKKLVDEQRRIASDLLAQGVGVVVEGRDIGTVVFPDAALKVFMQADDRIRAMRRVAQLAEDGRDTTFEDVLAEIKTRDARDRSRDVAPLRRAEDAIVVDTTSMTLEEQVRRIEALARSRTTPAVRATERHPNS